MKKTFSFALGNIWQWSKSKNKDDLISLIRKANLEIDGLEITIALKEDLYAIKISKANKSWLKSLEYITIHAPFKLKRKARDEAEVIKQLDIVEKLYTELGAGEVIIHPPDLPDPKILKKYNFNVSTENLPPRVKVSISDLQKILTKHLEVRLCLDVAHAYSWSKNETANLIKNFKDRISQIHFSGTYRKRDHVSLRKVTKNFMESIEPIKKLDVPIVIEEFVGRKGLKFLKEEIEYVKKLFD